MVGKRAAATQIAKWIGSSGQISFPPDFYFKFEAARELGCSVLELERHPEKHRLMAEAFTMRVGCHEGQKALDAFAEQQAKLNSKQQDQRYR